MKDKQFESLSGLMDFLLTYTSHKIDWYKVEQVYGLDVSIRLHTERKVLGVD